MEAGAPNHRLYYPLYVKCIELDIPFCTQVGHTDPLMPSKTGRPVPYLDEVALDFPELRIVAGQLGLSPEVEAQFLYENARRVFKLS